MTPANQAMPKIYVAFLRAVNVGGTGRLPMSDLRKMCEEVGFENVQTYIASGNVVFTSDKAKPAVKAALEETLRAYAGKPIAVFVRTAAEIKAILKKNPFPDREPKYTVVVFLDRKPPNSALAEAVGQTDEEMSIGGREIYVYYGSGMGHSKLRIPAARDGTTRNMNTIRKMAELVSKGAARHR